MAEIMWAAALALLALGGAGAQTRTAPVYVALGSSFAAGYGLPKQGPECGRSDHNYAHLVASAFSLDLVDVTCGGATTADLRSTQIKAVTDDTALVTITAGGNDAQYSASTLTCQSTDCLPTLPRKEINAALVALPGRLEKLVASIEARAPSATVVLVTYPEVVLANGARCKALHLTGKEAAYLHRLGRRLERVFLTVADNTDVVLVDPFVLSAGHGPCARPEQRWVAGATAKNGFPDHPTLVGHRAMADMVIAALQQT